MNTANKEFQFYLKNQDLLVERYNEKFIIIKDETVVNSFDNESDAIFYAKANYEPGTFIVQRCTPGKDDYTQVYHSRVIFA